MSGLAVLCSGQGYQDAGMFDLLADALEAEPIFKCSRAMLDGVDPRELVCRTTSEALHANRIGQILCCIQAMAAWAVLRTKVTGQLVVAGYSVGELAAWGVAGLLDYDEVLELAAKRAAAMDEAATQSGGLVAILGLKRAALDPICRARGAYVAIVNGSEHFLVGGPLNALEALMRDAQASGARRTARLPVAVASHTPLLAGASRKFLTALTEMNVSTQVRPNVRLLSGIDGNTVFDVRAGADKLARQIEQTVDWAACMQSCRSSNITKVLELGPGSALARLMREVMPEANAHSLSEFHSLPGVEQWLQGPPD
jgi:[acyl-carrier-protein] S-malonyltransferase